ncbi:MAG: hypothetical protein V1928_03170 [Parcubacteria group bacterium]
MLDINDIKQINDAMRSVLHEEMGKASVTVREEFEYLKKKLTALEETQEHHLRTTERIKKMLEEDLKAVMSDAEKAHERIVVLENKIQSLMPANIKQTL